MDGWPSASTSTPVTHSSDPSPTADTSVPGFAKLNTEVGRSRVTPAEFRRTLGQFPTGVTIVTARDPQTGGVHGMTANGFMSVSLHPPLVLVSIKRSAHMHQLLSEAGKYGVSFLTERLASEAMQFAGAPPGRGGPAPGFDSQSGVPVLHDAMAWLVAEVVDAHIAGDHTLFIGQVFDLNAGDADQPPLGFFRAKFARVSPIDRDESVPLEAWSSLDAWG
jgi:flavin reductase (DIM6/NTAB) family NADH-FMN oxidoreductase RutF